MRGARSSEVMGNIGEIPCQRTVNSPVAGLTKVYAIRTEQKLLASRENDIQAARAMRSRLGLISVDDDRHPQGYRVLIEAFPQERIWARSFDHPTDDLPAWTPYI